MTSNSSSEQAVATLATVLVDSPLFAATPIFARLLAEKLVAAQPLLIEVGGRAAAAAAVPAAAAVVRDSAIGPVGVVKPARTGRSRKRPTIDMDAVMSLATGDDKAAAPSAAHDLLITDNRDS